LTWQVKEHVTFYTNIETNFTLAAGNSPTAISLYDDGWLTTTTAAAAAAATVSTSNLPAAICVIHDATGRHEGGSYATAVTAVLW